MRNLLLLLPASLILVSCANLEQSPVKPVPNSARCAAIPSDIIRASKRKPEITGDSGFVVALNTLSSYSEQNKALKRMLRMYKRCRAAYNLPYYT